MTVPKLKSQILSHNGHHDSRCFPTVCVKSLGPELGRVEPLTDSILKVGF
jgi:hypothetical protein